LSRGQAEREREREREIRGGGGIHALRREIDRNGATLSRAAPRAKISGKILRKSFAYSNRYLAAMHLAENSHEENTREATRSWNKIARLGGKTRRRARSLARCRSRRDLQNGLLKRKLQARGRETHDIPNHQGRRRLLLARLAESFRTNRDY